MSSECQSNDWLLEKGERPNQSPKSLLRRRKERHASTWGDNSELNKLVRETLAACLIAWNQDPQGFGCLLQPGGHCGKLLGPRN